MRSSTSSSVRLFHVKIWARETIRSPSTALNLTRRSAPSGAPARPTRDPVASGHQHTREILRRSIRRLPRPTSVARNSRQPGIKDALNARYLRTQKKLPFLLPEIRPLRPAQRFVAPDQSPPTNSAIRSSVGRSAHWRSSNTSSKGPSAASRDTTPSSSSRILEGSRSSGCKALSPPVELRNESSELSPARAQQRLELVSVELHRQRAEHVDDWRERDPAAVELDTATQQSPSVNGPRADDELGDQPRFAHPGLAPHQDCDRPTAHDCPQAAVQYLQFGFASDQDRAHKDSTPPRQS